MEFGPREVLIVLGALLVCGIVLDGVRRMRAARRGVLRGPRRQPIFDENTAGDDGQFGSELPSGGARVIAYRDDHATAEVGEQLRRTADAEYGKRTAPFLERLRPRPEPAAGEAPVAHPETGPAEPPAAVETDTDPFTAVAEESAASPAFAAEPLVAEPVTADDLPLFRGEPAPPPPAATPKRAGRRRGPAVNGGGEPAVAEAEPIAAVVLHLMAPNAGTFGARPLFEALQKAGLEFGERHIFHRFPPDCESRKTPAFSVANAVKPGTFEGKVRDFQTPGVAFFLVIGDTPEPLTAFDDMLATARQVAAELGAELCDEQRSTLTRQVIADYRQRIVDGARGRAAGPNGGH